MSKSAAIALFTATQRPSVSIATSIRVIFAEELPVFESPKANEIQKELGNGVVVGITSRDRGQGIAFAAVNGERVFLETDAHGNSTLIHGEWEATVEAAAAPIWAARRASVANHLAAQNGGLVIKKAA